ncbi:MAG TPA: hypothetical protein GXX18_01175 [Bacillales bacterium]|nr:hypothetical protein [Bacillales bacterium]
MPERHLPLEEVFNQWYREKDGIAKFFRERNKQAALEPMKKQIANFLDGLFEINNLQINSKDKITVQVDKLEIKPINSKDRLSFMIESPNHYHSFIQLTELFEELEKQYRKLLAIEQSKTRITD